MNKVKYFAEKQRIEVIDYRTDHFMADKGIQINWSGIGAVSVVQAEKFANDLLEAVAYAKTLN